MRQRNHIHTNRTHPLYDIKTTTPIWESVAGVQSSELMPAVSNLKPFPMMKLQPVSELQRAVVFFYYDYFSFLLKKGHDLDPHLPPDRWTAHHSAPCCSSEPGEKTTQREPAPSSWNLLPVARWPKGYLRGSTRMMSQQLHLVLTECWIDGRTWLPRSHL